MLFSNWSRIKLERFRLSQIKVELELELELSSFSEISLKF